MAQGYRTFMEAQREAQLEANKHQCPVPIYRCATAKVFKFAVWGCRYGTRKVHVVQPEQKI
jgi:hypothetical protein